MIDKAFYNHFCNEVPGSGTTKTQSVKDNDTNVAVGPARAPAPAPAPESLELDTWDTKGAEGNICPICLLVYPVSSYFCLIQLLFTM